MEVLKELYYIHSPSGCEFRVQDRIRRELIKYDIKYEVDEYNQTYCFDYDGEPLLSAHTDQVGHEPTTHVIDTKSFFSGDTNIGADDKNGCWILLELLKTHRVNFVFSCEEEQGGNLEHLLVEHNLSKIPYALVFDRRGGGDIVGFDNYYCSREFEDAIWGIGDNYGYEPAMGTFSDCDCICEYMNCVNLSCGYHRAHTNEEYTDKAKLLNALEFGHALLYSDIQYQQFPMPEENWWTKSYRSSHNTSHSATTVKTKTGFTTVFGECKKCPDCQGLLIEYAMGSGKGSGYVCSFCGYDSQDSIMDSVLY